MTIPNSPNYANCNVKKTSFFLTFNENASHKENKQITLQGLKVERNIIDNIKIMPPR